jgi:hypothetical protein
MSFICRVGGPDRPEIPRAYVGAEGAGEISSHEKRECNGCEGYGAH